MSTTPSASVAYVTVLDGGLVRYSFVHTRGKPSPDYRDVGQAAARLTRLGPRALPWRKTAIVVVDYPSAPDLLFVGRWRPATDQYPAAVVTVSGALVWDPDHDPEDLCRCGHPYYRHWDSYEGDLAAIGCKYCSFGECPIGFVPASYVAAAPPV